MDFVTAHFTDVGKRKNTNQDSYAYKVVDTPMGHAAFAVICDGMGGLAKGELASKEITLAFCQWFDTEFAKMIRTKTFDSLKLRQQWTNLIEKENELVGEYGHRQGVMLGTTVTAILFINKEYYIVHVGDTRAYKITHDVEILTTDQTLVASEVMSGRLTKEQALVDPRRSVLLQCVGASPVVVPEFTSGDIKGETTFILCSDGFRHKIDDNELILNFAPNRITDSRKLSESCKMLSMLVIDRGETDNISVVVFKVF